MTKFNLLPRIDAFSSGIWPIELSGSNIRPPSIDLSKLKFMELDEPDPNMIGVSNEGAFPALIPPGLILGGLDQNRMVSYPAVVPAAMTVGVEVFCVEQNRFGNRAAPYLGGRAPVQFWLLRDQDRQSAIPIRRRNPASEQAHVWSEIKQLSERWGRTTESALDQVLASGEGPQGPSNLSAEAWGRATAFALEIEGSILLIESYANEKDARLMALATARSYRTMAPNRNLFLTKEAVERLLTKFVEKDFKSIPRRDFHFDEVRNLKNDLLFAEFTNYQNRLLVTV